MSSHTFSQNVLSKAGVWLGEKGHGNLCYTLQVFVREKQTAADPLSRTDDAGDNSEGSRLDSD